MRNLRIGKKNIIYPELSYKINGILFKSRNEAGQYGTEKQYCDTIEKLLKNREVSYEKEKFVTLLVNDKKQVFHKIDLLLKKKLSLKLRRKQCSQEMTIIKFEDV